MKRSALPSLACLLVLFFAPASVASQHLQIHHLDVDQGDATLFVMPNGRTMLVDAGEAGKGEAISAYLDSLGIAVVDAFVLTHYHSDHMAGASRVHGPNQRISTWYDRGGWTLDSDCNRRTQICQYQLAAQSATVLYPGSMIELDPAVTIYVVAASGWVRSVQPYPDIVRHDQENDRSVALLVSHNGFNYFLGGDLEREAERRLVMEAAVGDVDVYQVNHHGSHSSSTAAFLDMIRPEVAIISNGSHGGHRHPRQSTLDALLVRGIDVYQTNEYQHANPGGGNVNSSFILDFDPRGFGGAIVITVLADTYVITFPTPRGVPARTYPIQRPPL
jgi:competence protein ComEC